MFDFKIRVILEDEKQFGHPMHKTKISQEGYTEELSTCFNLETALIKSSKSALSET